MINQVTFPAMAEEFQVGLLSYGREAKLKAADFGVAHPDNHVAWYLHASDVLLTVAALVEHKLPARTLNKAIPSFYTNMVTDESVQKLFDELGEALLAHIAAIAPEDYFSEYKSSQVKRATNTVVNTLQKVLDARGHLVLFHLVYLSSTDANEEEELLSFVEAQLDEEAPQMYNAGEILKHVRAVNKIYKSWDKANVKLASNMGFTELDVAESIA